MVVATQIMTWVTNFWQVMASDRLSILCEHDSAELDTRRFSLKLTLLLESWSLILSILFATISGPIIGLVANPPYIPPLPSSNGPYLSKIMLNKKVLAPEVLTILINLVKISKQSALILFFWLSTLGCQTSELWPCIIKGGLWYKTRLIVLWVLTFLIHLLPWYCLSWLIGYEVIIDPGLLPL